MLLIIDVPNMNVILVFIYTAFIFGKKITLCLWSRAGWLCLVAATILAGKVFMLCKQRHH
jgi:hypothetical protein